MPKLDDTVTYRGLIEALLKHEKASRDMTRDRAFGNNLQLSVANHVIGMVVGALAVSLADDCDVDFSGPTDELRAILARESRDPN